MATKQKPHYAWLIMISCCAIMMVGIGVVNSCAGIFFMPVSTELGVGIGTLTLYMTIQSLVSMVFLPFAGKILARFDIRIILTAAFVVQLGGFASFSLAHSIAHYYVVGALMGVASVFIIYMAVPTLINTWFKEKVGTAMGIAMACSGLGGALFNPVGNAFIQAFGWRMGYVALAAISAVIVLPFTIFVIRNKPADKGLAPYGASADALTNAATAAADGIEAKKAIRSGAFACVILFVVFVAFTGGITSHVPGLAVNLGFDATTAAGASSVMLLGVTAGKLISGALNDKIGTSKGLGLVMVVAFVGCIVIIMSGGNLGMFFVGVALMGLGCALATFAPPVIVRSAFGSRDYTTIYSYISTVSALIGAVAVSMYGFVYDLSGAYITDIYVIGAMFALALVAMLFALKLSKKLWSDPQQ